MRIELTDGQAAFKRELVEFYERFVDPSWRETYDTHDKLASYLQSWDRTLYQHGWGAPNWPVEYGGRGSGAIERAIFAEETARFDAPEGLGRIGKRLVGPVLMAHGTHEQKKHIERILRGEEVWCQGFSEPDAGSDLASLRTRAVRDGEDWIVNGTKVWISFAQHAQWIFLLVRTGPLEARERSISILLSEINVPGVQVSPITTLAGQSEFNEVSFDDVRIPGTQLVGQVDEGWRIVREVLQHERGADYCLARLVDIRRITESMAEFATGASSEHILPILARQYTHVFSAQLMALDMLHHEERGLVPPGLESVLKLYTSEAWRALGDQQLTAWGGGFFQKRGDQALADLYESRHYTISAGTSEIQRNLIASRLLNLPSDSRGR